MRSVFLLQHTHEMKNGEPDTKIIGVYSSREKAEAAVSKFISVAGFKEYPEGFDIDSYEIDSDNWVEGFVEA